MEFNILIAIVVAICSGIMGMTKIGKLIAAVVAIFTIMPFLMETVLTIMFFINNPADVTVFTDVFSKYLIDYIYLLINLSVPSWVGLAAGVSLSEIGIGG